MEEYDFIDGYTLKTFLNNLNTVAKNSWVPIWNTFKEEFEEDKDEPYYYVITHRKKKTSIDTSVFG